MARIEDLETGYQYNSLEGYSAARTARRALQQAVMDGAKYGAGSKIPYADPASDSFAKKAAARKALSSGVLSRSEFDMAFTHGRGWGPIEQSSHLARQASNYARRRYDEIYRATVDKAESLLEAAAGNKVDNGAISLDPVATQKNTDKAVTSKPLPTVNTPLVSSSVTEEKENPLVVTSPSKVMFWDRTNDNGLFGGFFRGAFGAVESDNGTPYHSGTFDGVVDMSAPASGGVTLQSLWSGLSTDEQTRLLRFNQDKKSLDLSKESVGFQLLARANYDPTSPAVKKHGGHIFVTSPKVSVDHGVKFLETTVKVGKDTKLRLRHAWDDDTMLANDNGLVSLFRTKTEKDAWVEAHQTKTVVSNAFN